VIANCAFLDDSYGYTYPFRVPSNLKDDIRPGKFVTVESRAYQALPYTIAKVKTIDYDKGDGDSNRYVTSVCDNEEVDAIREREKDIPQFLEKCQEIVDKYNGRLLVDSVQEGRIQYTIIIDDN